MVKLEPTAAVGYIVTELMVMEGDSTLKLIPAPFNPVVVCEDSEVEIPVLGAPTLAAAPPVLALT